MPRRRTVLPRAPVFVATRRVDVPGVCHRYASVDGSVPGAAETWDHHVTGERINLDAMPATVDPAAFDGVGTTLADTDALASVVAFLLGGAGHLPPAARATLEAASHWCDHLVAHPDHDRRANARGRALDAWIAARLAAATSTGRSSEFARLCRLVARRVLAGRSLPRERTRSHRRLVRALADAGRLRTAGGVLVADLRRVPARARPGPAALYAASPDCLAAVTVDTHADGGLRYTVGRNARAPGAPTDLSPVLAALARAEFAHGPPARTPTATPGSENWGGRKEVGGSPWNYGSRLSVEEVAGVLRAFLAGG